jgi:hypothetical protein
MLAFVVPAVAEASVKLTAKAKPENAKSAANANKTKVPFI